MKESSVSRLTKIRWLPALFAALIALLFFKDFGVAWDDPLQSRYGDLLIAHYATHGEDVQYESLADLRYYGGAFEIPAQLATRISPWTPVQTRRLVGGLVGALGVLGATALGGLVGGPVVGFLSGFLLATWPAWMGHSFINSKDIPFATAFVWSVYFLLRVARAGAEQRPRDHAGFALATGLAIGTRAGGLILFACYLTLAVRAMVLSLRGSHDGKGARGRTAFRGLSIFAGGAALAWTLMVLAWPWTQAAPFTRPFEAAELMTRFPRPMEVLFNGKLITTTRLGWDYVPTWFAVTLPPLVVILLCALIPVILLGWKRSFDKGAPLAAGIFLICGGAPVIAAILGRVVLYDGVRQMLFVVPLFVVAASWTANALWNRIGSAKGRVLALVLAAVACLDPVAALVRLHPYQYVYFNRFVGGLRGAALKFETDYWGLAMRESAEWVSKNRALLKRSGTLKVHVPNNCAEPTSAGEYLDPAIQLTDNNLAANVVLAPTRFKCDTTFIGTPVYRVEREGAVLAIVKVMD